MNNRRNSVVILAKNINMDKEYINIIDYNESDVVTLCRSTAHLVAEQNNYSFLRIGDNVINVGIPYATCLQANYIAMQNPYYSNKWFFAFIDKVEYNSEASTNIYYTVDEITTWWDYWTKKDCFVIREHVNDDTVGANTIDEGLDTGEYILNSTDHAIFNEYYYLVQTSNVITDPAANTNMSTFVNGIYCQGHFYACSTKYALDQTLLAAQNSTNPKIDILAVYIVPTFLITLSGYNIHWDGAATPVYTTKTITKQTTLDGYSPVNKKLLCYPYNYLLETNTSGNSNTFKYEYFSNNPEFSIGGTATVGANIVSIPINYKFGDEVNMLTASKFATCGWSTDAYKSWLNQQGINIGNLHLNAEQYGYGLGALQIAGGAIAAASGNAVLGTAMISGGMTDITSTLTASMSYKQMPTSFQGNLNSGDFFTAAKKNGFYFYKMSIKSENARVLDEYFTKYGYKVNRLKKPNFTGRTYFNYVKISSDDIIGISSNSTVNVPESSMDIINAVFRKGTTIWHNHDNIGNYSLSNTIVSNNS